MAFTPYEIEQASTAVRTVKEIDLVMVALVDLSSAKKSVIGDNVRSAVGRNVFSQFTNDQIGTIVSAALMNALMERRQVVVDVYQAIVDLPRYPQVYPETSEYPPSLR